MKIISAIGSFKGSIDSVKINNLVKEILEKEGHFVDAIPVADGGDGLLDSLCSSLNGKYVEVQTVNALGEPIVAKIGIVGDTGIVEMALASGVALIPEKDLNPLKASTYGTGILIKHLADMGIKNIILGIGGSATNDGGFGCLNALGFEFYDKDNNPLIPSGENLQYVKKISSENVPSNIKNLKIQIACDVTNTLLGKNGATYVYGRQKGATDEMLEILEKGLENYSKAVASFCDNDYSEFAGTGAAGGLGYGLMSLLNAKLQKGAEIVLDCAKYIEKLENADLVITGEGRIDNQTEFGKLPQIVAKTAEQNGVKCIAIAGSSTATKESLDNMGIKEVYQLIDYAPLDECLSNPESVIKMVLKNIIEI